MRDITLRNNTVSYSRTALPVNLTDLFQYVREKQRGKRGTRGGRGGEEGEEGEKGGKGEEGEGGEKGIEMERKMT